MRSELRFLIDDAKRVVAGLVRRGARITGQAQWRDVALVCDDEYIILRSMPQGYSALRWTVISFAVRGSEEVDFSSENFESFAQASQRAERLRAGREVRRVEYGVACWKCRLGSAQYAVYSMSTGTSVLVVEEGSADALELVTNIGVVAVIYEPVLAFVANAGQ